MQRASISNVLFTHPHIVIFILSFVVLEWAPASFNSTLVASYEWFFFDVLHLNYAVFRVDKVVIENTAWLNDHVFLAQEPFCFEIVFLCVLTGFAEVTLVPETKI